MAGLEQPVLLRQAPLLILPRQVLVRDGLAAQLIFVVDSGITRIDTTDADQFGDRLHDVLLQAISMSVPGETPGRMFVTTPVVSG